MWQPDFLSSILKWKNRPATAFLRIRDSSWIAYKMKIQRKNSYKWNSTSYLWVKRNIIFRRRITWRYSNDFLRYENFVWIYKACFSSKIIFPDRHMCSIEIFPFQFMFILCRVLTSQKSCGNSIFWVHMHIIFSNNYIHFLYQYSSQNVCCG